MIELFQSKKNRQFYFRIRSPNNRILAQSEGYKTKTGRRRGIAAIVKLCSDGASTFDRGLV